MQFHIIISNQPKRQVVEDILSDFGFDTKTFESRDDESNIVGGEGPDDLCQVFEDCKNIDDPSFPEWFWFCFSDDGEKSFEA